MPKSGVSASKAACLAAAVLIGMQGAVEGLGGDFGSELDFKRFI